MKTINSFATIGGIDFKWGDRTYVMGILNITPDSFSGDGLMSSVERVFNRSRSEFGIQQGDMVALALAQARRFVEIGVDILDIGGESTRPGAQPISLDEELDRVIPVIRAISEELEVVISIDTYKATVAEAALRAGAHLVNDVWALKADPNSSAVIMDFNVPIILMHNRSNPSSAEVRDRLGGRYIGVQYDNLIEDIKRELMESVDFAHQAGISDDQIILDPGIGFGKTVKQNLELLNRLGEFRSLGYPLLIGPSRKSFIGYTLDLPPDQRIEGTAAAVAVGIVRGADIIRIHDVETMYRVARMTDAIVRGD
jgi:dihydropteroate synthase